MYIITDTNFSYTQDIFFLRQIGSEQNHILLLYDDKQIVNLTLVIVRKHTIVTIGYERIAMTIKK